MKILDKPPRGFPLPLARWGNPRDEAPEALDVLDLLLAETGQARPDLRVRPDVVGRESLAEKARKLSAATVPVREDEDMVMLLRQGFAEMEDRLPPWTRTRVP